jgi:hypothetical protein
MNQQPGPTGDEFVAGSGYVRTVAPLASDPAIQQAVADQITAQVLAYLDVQGLTNQAVEALAEQGVRPQLADRLRGFAGPIGGTP